MQPLDAPVDDALPHECLLVLPLLRIPVVLLIIAGDADPLVPHGFLEGCAQPPLRLPLLHLVIYLKMVVGDNLLEPLVPVREVYLPLRDISLVALRSLNLPTIPELVEFGIRLVQGLGLLLVFLDQIREVLEVVRVYSSILLLFAPL
jgi:hypothetical protein